MDDEALRQLAREFRQGVLGSRSSRLMCMVVSAPLQGLLRAVYELDTTLEVVMFPQGSHAWLRLSDERILDATADQFGLEAIYLGNVPERYRQWMSAVKKRQLHRNCLTG